MTSHNAREPVEAIPGEIAKTARDLVGDYLDISDRRGAQLAKLVAKALHEAVMAEKAKSEEMIVALRLADQFFDHLKNSWEVCDHTQSMMDKIKAALPAAPKTEG